MRAEIGQVAKAFMGRKLGHIFIKVQKETEAGYEGKVVAYDVPWVTKRIGDTMQILKVQVVEVFNW